MDDKTLQIILGRFDKLEEGQAVLERGQAAIEKRLDKLEDGQVAIEKRLDNLERGQAALEKEILEIKADLKTVKRDGKITRVTANTLVSWVEDISLLGNFHVKESDYVPDMDFEDDEFDPKFAIPPQKAV
jgi:chromosome segregation ATPase